MTQDISKPANEETSTPTLPECSGQISFTTEEVQRLHFTDNSLIATWLREAVISPIIREALSRWHEPLTSRIKSVQSSKQTTITLTVSISGSLTLRESSSSTKLSPLPLA